MQMFRSLIALRNVTKAFDRQGHAVPALDRMSFSVGRDEFVSVLGPSGCGKSTLLRLIAGLVRPTSGSIEINDLQVTEPRDDVGIVFQKPTLLPWLSALDNIIFPLKHKYGRVSAEEKDKARELLRIVGLTDFMQSMPDQLSGGMQQRVSIARALLLDPYILLMDEPFSALDALTRDQMSFELLDIIKQRPKTVVFITHSITEAVLLSDRIVVMSDRPGTVREILTVDLPRPRNLDTLSHPRYNDLTDHIRRSLFSRRAA
jgi:NitT/TauT family transport system ATP-binding protein